MKFYQIAAAVLIFKLFDWSFLAAAELTGSRVPLLVYLIAFLIWVILSLLAWLLFRRAEEELASRGL